MCGGSDIPLINPKDLNDAYGIQHVNYHRLGKIGGWKLGGCSQASRAFFNVDHVYYGPIFEREIYQNEITVSMRDNTAETVGELEVAFRLSDSISDYLDNTINITSISKYIRSVAPVIEMPWLSFPINSDSLPMVIADQCVSGGLVVGDELVVEHDLLNSMNNLEAELLCADSAILTGNTNDLIGGPLSIFCEFIQVAQSHKLNLQPNQIVSLGAFSVCGKIPRNHELKANFGSLGSFSFLIK